ncbi:MAG: HD domain-containing protein [Halobacteriovoraceae bacterium]|nr:HD domain-containing protein [Halobacteriovoraceae bacterium]MBT5093253.1 HD domain-containing protein [Halobacteriovoraceae bacterium]
MRKDKFVKVLSVGDCITSNRLEKYIDKGLGHLFIKKSEQEGYVSFCQQVVANLHSVEIPSDSKIKMTLTSGDETLKYLKDQGLDDESIEYAKEFACNAQKTVEGLAANEETIKSLILNASVFEHSSGTALIAGLVARELGYENKKQLQNLGLAALLHDIGLFESDGNDKIFLEEFDVEEELNKKSTSADRKEALSALYNDHPGNAAFMLSKIKTIDDEILLMVEQHHMRPMGRGFPTWNFQELQLHPLGQILAISDEYSKSLSAFGRGKINKSELNSFSKGLGSFDQKLRKAFLAIFFA